MTYFVATNAALPMWNNEVVEPLSLYEELSESWNCELYCFEQLLDILEQFSLEQAKDFQMKFLITLADDIKALDQESYLAFHNLKEETLTLTLSEQIYLLFKNVKRPQIEKMICPFSKDKASKNAAYLQAGFLAEQAYRFFMDDAEKFLLNYLKETYR